MVPTVAICVLPAIQDDAHGAPVAKLLPWNLARPPSAGKTALVSPGWSDRLNGQRD
jgi:hypothetical protein